MAGTWDVSYLELASATISSSRHHLGEVRILLDLDELSNFWAVLFPLSDIVFFEHVQQYFWPKWMRSSVLNLHYSFTH